MFEYGEGTTEGRERLQHGKGFFGSVNAEIACLFAEDHVCSRKRRPTCTNPAGREVGTSSGVKQAFQLRQRHRNQKGWQMRLAQPICFTVFGWRQRRDFFHFLRNIRNGHLRRTTGAVVVGEAEDGEKVDLVDHNPMASMDLVFNTQRYHIFSYLFTWLLARLHVIEALLTIKQDRRVLSFRAAPLTTGCGLENAAAAMSASAFSPNYDLPIGAGRHRRHDNIANSDLAKDEVKLAS